jgi:hypothetical protein
MVASLMAVPLLSLLVKAPLERRFPRFPRLRGSPAQALPLFPRAYTIMTERGWIRRSR